MISFPLYLLGKCDSQLVNTMESKTLDLKQAADLLNVHWQTLREMAKAGEIPGAKIGRSWVFVESDLLEFIRSKYTDPRSRSQVQL